MKFINEDGEIVEGELVPPLEEEALESFKQKLNDMPEYLTTRTKSGIMRMLAKNFVIHSRLKAVEEPEYLSAEARKNPDIPLAETEYGDFPSPDTTEAA